MSELAFLIDRLEDDGQREWLSVGQKYTGTIEQRAEIVQAITTIHWQHPGEPMPMSPGLLLQAIIARSGFTHVARLGYSVHEIRHPDCSCRDPHHPDHFASYSIVGVKMRERATWWTFYLLDTGGGAVPLVNDLVPAIKADGMTASCAMELCDECKPAATSDNTLPCVCTCHVPAEQLTKPQDDHGD